MKQYGLLNKQKLNAGFETDRVPADMFKNLRAFSVDSLKDGKTCRMLFPVALIPTTHGAGGLLMSLRWHSVVYPFSSHWKACCREKQRIAPSSLCTIKYRLPAWQPSPAIKARGNICLQHVLVACSSGFLLHKKKVL